MKKLYTVKEVKEIVNAIRQDTKDLVMHGGFYRNNFKTLFCNLLDWNCDKQLKELTKRGA